MGICLFDFLRPNNTLNLTLLLPVFAYFSQVTVAKIPSISYDAPTKTGNSNIRLSALFCLKKLKKRLPIVQYYLDFSKNALNLK